MPYLTQEEYDELEAEAASAATLRAERDNLAAANAELREALEFMTAFTDNSGDIDGEWQKYAFKHWGGVWSVSDVTKAEKQARAVLAKGAK